MRRYVLSLVSVFALGFMIGCGETTDPAANPESGSATASTDETSSEEGYVHAALLCGKCGEEKGTDSCCAEDAEKCACGMTKGSALCCKELGEDVAGKDICSGCGHAVEADEHHHCDEDCETCDKCGLHADAPACCKLDKEEG